MKKGTVKNEQIRNQIKKGLDLTAKKLLQTKRKSEGILVFSEKGRIRKIRASNIKE